MNTEFMLMAKHEDPLIPLEEICDTYLGLSYKKAKEQALRDKLPFPTARLTGSQKAPLCVHVADLAKHIDTVFERARKDHAA